MLREHSPARLPTAHYPLLDRAESARFPHRIATVKRAFRARTALLGTRPRDPYAI
jgi:hypothetical protein